MNVTIREAARVLGVSIVTLRRWEKDGKIKPVRTPGGHRRFDLDRLRSMAARPAATEPDARLTIGFVYAPTADDLRRHAARLTNYCHLQAWKLDLVKDASPSPDKKALQLIFKFISSGNARRLVVLHKDALHRFGPDLIPTLCEQFSVEIVIANLPD